MSDLWHYRGRRLRQLEWGLWRDLDRPGYFFLCYRPQGRNGPYVRRWAYAPGRQSLGGGGDGIALSLQDLQQHVRTVHAAMAARSTGVPPHSAARPLVKEYVQELERRNRALSTTTDVRRGLGRYLDATATERLEDITTRAIERWLGTMAADGASARTQNRYRGHLRTWLEWARRRGLVASNAADGVGRATEERRLPVFPRPEQMITLVEAAPDRYAAGIICLLGFTGLRRGSLVSLQTSSFLPDGIRVLHTKRRREWFLSYADGCPLWREDLSDLGRGLWADHAPEPAEITAAVQSAARAAGPPYAGFTCPSLRHGFASWLVMMGEHLMDVAAWCHHSTAATTEAYYVHLRPHGRAQLAGNQRAVVTMRSQCLARAFDRPYSRWPKST